jgi:hypothetical protein
VAGGATEINEQPLSSTISPSPSGKTTSSTCGFTSSPGVVAQGVDLDLAVEMADVADNRTVLHMPHVVDRDHVVLPVAVTKTSSCAAASSIVVT